MGPFSTHRFLTRLSLSAAHIFAWLFIFQYFYVFSGVLLDSLTATAISYAFSQIVAILIMPLAARRLRHGVRGMLVNALLSLATAYAILALAFAGLLGSIPLGILCFALCMGLYRALYWMPYEVASKKSRGGPTHEVLLSFVPALAGYGIAFSSSAPILVLAAASLVALVAIIPLYAMRNTQEGFSWQYRETFHHLFTSTHRKPLIQAICHGFEGAALLLLWPIAILVLLDWSYAMLGIVISITYLCSIIAKRLLARVHTHVRTPLVLSVLTFSGWMLRGTVAAPISIVLVDSYFQSGSGIAERGVDLLTMEQSADSNTYIDEFTALKDMGQGIGRVIFCFTLFVLAPFFTFATLALTLFFVAAAFAVLSIVISRTVTKHAF